MPQLRCNADNCAHNANNCCCNNEIKVDGQQAQTSSNTCCSNFCESQGNMQDAVDQAYASPETEVDCSAQNCAHNDNCKCHADSVDVSGAGACNCDGTCCSTFKPE